MKSWPIILRVDLMPPIRNHILRRAREEAPRECCGLLVGLVGNDGTAVPLQCQPTRNLSENADRFEIDPEGHFAILRQAREDNLDVIGCYHSHPNGRAEPSAVDLAGAGEDNFLWLIAAGERLSAFVYRGGSFFGADWVTSSE
jgi:proteasome lid subunit RPN8/RPN11